MKLEFSNGSFFVLSILLQRVDNNNNNNLNNNIVLQNFSYYFCVYNKKLIKLKKNFHLKKENYSFNKKIWNKKLYLKIVLWITVKYSCFCYSDYRWCSLLGKQWIQHCFVTFIQYYYCTSIDYPNESQINTITVSLSVQRTNIAMSEKPSTVYQYARVTLIFFSRYSDSH